MNKSLISVVALVVLVLGVGVNVCAKEVNGTMVYIKGDMKNVKKVWQQVSDINRDKDDYHLFPRTTLVVNGTQFWDGRFDNDHLNAKKDGTVDAILRPNSQKVVLSQEEAKEISPLFRERIKKEVLLAIEDFKEIVEAYKDGNRFHVKEHKDGFCAYFKNDSSYYGLTRDQEGIVFEVILRPYANDNGGCKEVILIHANEYKKELEKLIRYIKRGDEKDKTMEEFKKMLSS